MERLTASAENMPVGPRARDRPRGSRRARRPTSSPRPREGRGALPRICARLRRDQAPRPRRGPGAFRRVRGRTILSWISGSVPTRRNRIAALVGPALEEELNDRWRLAVPVPVDDILEALEIDRAGAGARISAGALRPVQRAGPLRNRVEDPARRGSRGSRREAAVAGGLLGGPSRVGRRRDLLRSRRGIPGARRRRWGSTPAPCWDASRTISTTRPCSFEAGATSGSATSASRCPRCSPRGKGRRRPRSRRFTWRRRPRMVRRDARRRARESPRARDLRGPGQRGGIPSALEEHVPAPVEVPDRRFRCARNGPAASCPSRTGRSAWMTGTPGPEYRSRLRAPRS